MTVYLMRHGESLASHNRTIFSKMDPRLVPLTQWGFEQTTEAGKAFRKFYDDNSHDRRLKVFYSPHLRIVQSKDGFMTGFGSKNVNLIQGNELLKEREHGEFDGLHPKLQKQKDPDLYNKLHHGSSQEKYSTPMPKGESIADVQQRMEIFISSVIENAKEDEDILIISHGGNCRLLEQLLLTNHPATWLDFEDTPEYGQIMKIDDTQPEEPFSEVIFHARQRPKTLKNVKAESYYPRLEAPRAI